MPTEMQQSLPGANAADTIRFNLIESARQKWIDRLIDLSRRNNLLYYRPVSSGTIDIPDGCKALEDLIAGKAVTAQALMIDALDRPSRILNIARKAMENLEEKGLQTLYLGLGFASWTAKDGGRDVKAPIFMLPISFKQKGRDPSSVAVEVVGDVQVNPVLLHVLNTDFNITLSDDDLLPGDKNGADVVLMEHYTHAIDSLKASANRVPGFTSEASAVIGNFAFAKLAMVNDLKESASALAKHDMIAAIAGDDAARAKLGSCQTEVDPRSLDANSPNQEFCVVEADSSQQCAINGILVGQSAVVHGPPGTGKSQTITNLIATLVGNGKTVLFVAEKRAALKVVQRRLKASNLDHLAMDLHGAELSPKKVMARIGETLSAVRNARQPATDDLHRQFVDRRSKLNAHDQRMHTVFSQSGKSVFDMQGELLRLPSEASSAVRWRGAELTKITPLAAEQIRDLLAEAGGFVKLIFGSDPSPWTGVAFADGGSVQGAIDTAQQLAYECSPAADRCLTNLEAQLGFSRPQTMDQVFETIQFLKSAHSILNNYLPEVFTTDLRPFLAEMERAQESSLKATWLGFFDAKFKSTYRGVIGIRKGVKATPKLLHAELIEVGRIIESWTARSKGSSHPGSYAELDKLASTYATLLRAARSLQSAVGQSRWEQSTLVELSERIGSYAADSITPYRLLRLTEIEAKLKALGVQRLLDDIRNRKPSETLWCSLFTYSWLHSMLDEMAGQAPIVKGFVGTSHSQYVEDFKRLDADRLKAASARVTRIHAERAVATMNAHPEQEALIKQEAAKSRRHKPLRTLFRDASEVMTTVCPCWMASPLSVSQLIDRSARFDYVIFDEASQILPEDAVPAIMRGKLVVVAGDNKQLPPTGFFSAGIDEVDEPEVVDGYESLLDMMLPFVKSFHLNWHYRSRDESLISFSNHHIYDGRLVTFPGPGGAPALTHSLVNHVPESDRQEDSSSAEVTRVVEMIIKHARTTPAQTLGVITMGIKHAMRIQGALDASLRDHPGLNAFFDTERLERFFIKNLERVQGDERDSIILSVGYGKDRGGNLPLRFGPILSEGGRRRLNVAVTRARETMTVVSSFAHTDIDTNSSRSIRYCNRYRPTG